MNHRNNIAAGLLALVSLASWFLWRRAGKQAKAAALTARYGTAAPAEIAADV